MSTYFTYRTVSAYSTGTVRSDQMGGGPVTKPFAPFVPKFNGNGNGDSDGYVTNKKIVPISSSTRPYGYGDESGDEWKHPPTSPVRSSPRKVDEFNTKMQNEAIHPARSSHVTSPDWRHSSQPKPYNAYDDYGSTNPIGGTTNNGKHDASHNGAYYGNMEASKPVAVMDKHGGYNNGNNGYGDHSGRKPIGSTTRDDGPNGYGDYGANKEGRKPISHDNGYGGDYGNYGNKEGRNLIGSLVKDIYDGYGGNGDYNNKERPNLSPKPTNVPTYNDGYGTGGGDYSNYGNKEGPKLKPTSSPTYNNGYGGYAIGNDRSKPFGSESPTRRDNYDHEGGDYGNNYNKEGYKPAGPKATSDWAASPRKVTQLSKPMNDIGEAVRLLESEAARLNGNGRGYNGGPKPYEYDGPGPLANRPVPAASKFDKGMNLVSETEKLKKIVTGAAPQIQARSSVPVKNETRPNGNFNLVPTRPRFNLVDGRGPDYDARRSYGVMDHKQAEKEFNGMTI
ncbi:hypothetical protein CR513_28023, partial [Mucuna pruriens]